MTAGAKSPGSGTPPIGEGKSASECVELEDITRIVTWRDGSSRVAETLWSVLLVIYQCHEYVILRSEHKYRQKSRTPMLTKSCEF